MKNRKQGAVLIEVLVALFITAVVFIGVYTTISVSLINTRYLQQARETSNFASQLAEGFAASRDCEEYSCFDYIKNNYEDVPALTEINLEQVTNYLSDAKELGWDVISFMDYIDEAEYRKYKVQLFLISPNAVYLNENSLGTPFGSGVYSPDENLMTFELRVQRNSKDWGGTDFRIYKERQPAVVSYIFQVTRSVTP